jgi:hypothetical protein
MKRFDERTWFAGLHHSELDIGFVDEGLDQFAGHLPGVELERSHLLEGECGI